MNHRRSPHNRGSSPSNRGGSRHSQQHREEIPAVNPRPQSSPAPRRDNRPAPRPQQTGPLYTREDREFIWPMIRVVAACLIDPIVDAVGEDEAKQRFMSMSHVVVERYFSIVYDHLQMMRIIAESSTIDAIRLAEVDSADKALVNFRQDVDELGTLTRIRNGSNELVNDFARVQPKGMGRKRRAKMFEWLVNWCDSVHQDHENELIGGAKSEDWERKGLQHSMRFAKNFLWMARLAGDIHVQVLSEQYRRVTGECLPESLVALDAEFRPLMGKLHDAYTDVSQARRNAKDDPDGFDAAVSVVKELTNEVKEFSAKIVAEDVKLTGQIAHATQTGATDLMEGLATTKMIMEIWMKLLGAVQTRCAYGEFVLDIFWLSMRQAGDADQADWEARNADHNQRNGTTG